MPGSLVVVSYSAFGSAAGLRVRIPVELKVEYRTNTINDTKN